MAESVEKVRYTLYTAPTPNGHKISILLEELNVAYDVKPMDFRKLEQKEDWFLKLNPNGRIPVLVDHEKNDFVIFESGAILLYLAETYSQFLGKSLQDKSNILQWLFFQHGGLGPMQGQAHVFVRYADENIPFAIERYQKETKRLYTVLNSQLKENGSGYIAGSDYSIADIALYPWIRIHRWAKIEIDDLPELSAWKERISQRQAVQRGLDVPTPNKSKETALQVGAKLVN